MAFANTKRGLGGRFVRAKTSGSKPAAWPGSHPSRRPNADWLPYAVRFRPTPRAKEQQWVRFHPTAAAAATAAEVDVLREYPRGVVLSVRRTKDPRPSAARSKNPKPRMTYKLAMSVLHDTANRAMRKGKRKAWSRADYNAGIKEFHRVYPLKQELDDRRQGRFPNPDELRLYVDWNAGNYRAVVYVGAVRIAKGKMAAAGQEPITVRRSANLADIVSYARRNKWTLVTITEEAQIKAASQGATIPTSWTKVALPAAKRKSNPDPILVESADSIKDAPLVDAEAVKKLGKEWRSYSTLAALRRAVKRQPSGRLVKTRMKGPLGRSKLHYVYRAPNANPTTAGKWPLVTGTMQLGGKAWKWGVKKLKDGWLTVPQQGPPETRYHKALHYYRTKAAAVVAAKAAVRQFVGLANPKGKPPARRNQQGGTKTWLVHPHYKSKRLPKQVGRYRYQWWVEDHRGSGATLKYHSTASTLAEAKRRLMNRIRAVAKVKNWSAYVFDGASGDTSQRIIVERHGGPNVKPNPEAAAAKLSEKFHQRPAKTVRTLKHTKREHRYLTELGRLIWLKVYNKHLKRRFDIDFPNDRRPVYLASSEDGKQLYIEGGDQELPLRAMGLDTKKWLRDSMVIGELVKFQYRTKKGMHDFEIADYHHRTGEDSGVRPIVLYDLMNHTIAISGGQYDVRAEGVVN